MAERLYVDRKRRGETLRAASRRHGVAQWRYTRWEAGESGAPCPSLRGITMGEQLAVLRRRLGMTQRGFAEVAGARQSEVCRVERGVKTCNPVVDFWEGGR